MLADVLSKRLQPIVPAGFHVTQEAGMLRFAMDSGMGFYGGRSGSYVEDTFNLDTDIRSVTERALRASALALGQLQDFVAEETADPWPGATDMPPARAELRAGHLLLYFGEPAAPVLQCEPIDI
jgi:hypothetical protein